MRALDALGHALGTAGSMAWQVTWSLILGFTLSGIVQAVIRRQTVIRLLGDDKPKTLAVATGLGAASSSCSYAAVALARSLVRRGADFTAAIAFEIASTNLVIELGIILALLIAWQFTLAEFIGGPIMIVLMAVAFRLFVRQRLIAAARQQADQGVPGSMEGHAAMDMSIAPGGSLRRRLISRDGYTSVKPRPARTPRRPRARALHPRRSPSDQCTINLATSVPLGLRHLGERIGGDFIAGIVLYIGSQTLRASCGCVPVSAPWRA
jgi:uncharacterized membrane protein YraQ (UPF0718 family)